MGENKAKTSPKWSSNTKLIVALAFLTVVALLLTFYHTIVGPLIVAFIISYLLRPLAEYMCRYLKLSWGAAVNIIYLVFILTLLILVVSGGVFLINQMQGLVVFIQNAIKGLPAFLDDFSGKKYAFGPFMLDMALLDVSTIGNQILNAAQNLVGQVGSILASVASSTAVVLGWVFFVVMISYFVLFEAKDATHYSSYLNLPGYEDDLNLLEESLVRIWDAFLRGQIIVTGLNMLIYTLLLGSLGVQYFYVLAFVAGIARFIPYLGAWVSWTTFGLVAFFQGSTFFGLDSFPYAMLIIGVAIVIDSIMDNIVTPRILSNALQVHPAAVMVAALIGISWLGIIGVILAAPVLATLKLFGNYALMKLFDNNPWANMDTPPARPQIFSLVRLRLFIGKVRQLYHEKFRR